jgi:hypothetical protein
MICGVNLLLFGKARYRLDNKLASLAAAQQTA